MDVINIPRPQASRWISKSLFQATKFPVESLVRCFNTEALGAVVLVGGLYDTGLFVEDMLTFVRLLAMKELLLDELAD